MPVWPQRSARFTFSHDVTRSVAASLASSENKQQRHHLPPGAAGAADDAHLHLQSDGRRWNMYEMCITAAQQQSVCRLSTWPARGLKGQPEEQRAGGGVSPPSVAEDEHTSQNELDCHLQFVHCVEKQINNPTLLQL